MKTHRAKHFLVLTRAFTLLELVIALTIIAMLSGTVYAIISGSVQAAARMQKTQVEKDQVNRFIQVLRQNFQSLPSTATVKIKTIDNAAGLQELTISGLPDCFGFGAIPISYKDTVIGLRPDQDATERSDSKQQVFFIGITREDIIPEDASGHSAQMVRSAGIGDLAPDDQGRVWMPLMTNVSALTWRAYKDDNEQWVDEWSSSAFPQLVEMNLTLSEHTQPMRVVFATPAMKLAGANSSLAMKTQTTTGTTGSTATAAAGGNASGGAAARGGKGGDSKGSKGGKGGPQGAPAPPGSRGGRSRGGAQPSGQPSQPGQRTGGFAPAGGAPAAPSGGFAPAGGGKR